jgi:hypothetical protein
MNLEEEEGSRILESRIVISIPMRGMSTEEERGRITEEDKVVMDLDLTLGMALGLVLVLDLARVSLIDMTTTELSTSRDLLLREMKEI